MFRGEVPVEGTNKGEVKRLRLGFATEELGYSISLGLPAPTLSDTAFSLDPEIKREVIWAGPWYRPASALADRKESLVKVRSEREWNIAAQNLQSFDSIFDQVADPNFAPEVFWLREIIRGWRFYDHFRTDSDAPARQAQLGTRSPVLDHDGQNLAAALQTIREIGDHVALDRSVSDAFPGSSLRVVVEENGRFTIRLFHDGLLRPVTGAELSDGTIRFLLWIAALLTPRPPSLMVLNEPETSLHPDLLPALARLIIQASKHSQVWVVSHAKKLTSALAKSSDCNFIELEKELSQTQIKGQRILERPPWHWPD
jgi:predicted ATPase